MFPLQYIDHFDYTNDETFSQKYLVSSMFYIIILYIYNTNVSYFRHIP